MKKLFLIFLFLNSQIIFAQFPDWANDLSYFSIGSCETHDLNFNAARFTKIDLEQKRDGLDLNLQIILFLQEDGVANFRLQEMGLVGCQLDANKNEICSYRPYPDTKKMLTTSWLISGDQLIVQNIGTITKIRDDFPWLGYNLSIGSDFPYEIAHGKNIIGGKVQINFNNIDQNVVKICRPTIIF